MNKLALILIVFVVILFVINALVGNKELIASQTGSVIQDTIAPEVFISSPENLYNSQSPSLTVLGTSRDENNVKEIRLKLNNGNWQTVCNNNCGSWNAVLTLNNGYNAVYVQAVDSNDNFSPVSSRTYSYGIGNTLNTQEEGRSAYLT